MKWRRPTASDIALGFIWAFVVSLFVSRLASG
ncbi:hypothetical protein SAMN05216268_12661 [Streptomyces yunnanensis]|uniref:Uncharacterized protein n=1 Tax=Streptomyces yunnanensis TaxID=156453 RepID=A0A9X8N7T6_9ACTN|nr:hypothetical protein SAMN05216268_12661 [Streptomyces yunnanensis]